MARARRLSAAGAVTAFVVAGVSLAAGLGTAAAATTGASTAASAASTAASTGAAPRVPGTRPDCVLPLPALCDEPDDASWSGGQAPGDPRAGTDGSRRGHHGGGDSWPAEPAPDDSWSNAPAPGATLPGGTVPGATVPDGTVPDGTVPDDTMPDDSWPAAPAPGDTWSDAPAPQDSWPSQPGPVVSDRPWRPAGQREHRIPRGHPETGGGGLAEEGAAWPFAAGGTALLAGAGLTGFAVRRRRTTP
ncbi:hypothetical protein [Nonomuraea sp. NPDC050783]|uniref:hypothetical protein n=1 Tax=Nonomuraea sp. NPDC050783 TaxID=3154634 RepID=UPI003466EE39